MRNSKGFSLATVMIVMSLSAIWLTGISAMVLTIYRDVARSKFDSEIKNIAESATDYYISKLNNPMSRVDYDAEAVDTDPPTSRTKAILPSILGAPSNASISAEIRNCPPPETSAVYDGRLDKNKPNSVYPANPWRVLKVTATLNGLSRTLTTTLRPVVLANPQPNSVGFFQYAMLATDSLTMLNTTTAGHWGSTESSAMKSNKVLVDPAPNGTAPADAVGDIRAFNTVVLQGGNTIGGDVVASNVSSSAGDAVNGAASPPPDDLTPSQKYFDQFYAGNNGFDNTAALPPALEASSTIAGRASQLTGETDSLSGDYAASSIKVDTPSPLVPETNQQVRVFLDSAAGETAAQIHGNVNEGGNPSNFQIWYNGTGTLNIDAEKFSGLVYAPNASVIIGSTTTSTRTSFNGSVVARNIETKNADVIYRPEVLRGSGKPGFDPNTYTDGSSTNFKYKVASVAE